MHSVFSRRRGEPLPALNFVAVAILLLGGLVPPGPVLAAPADVGIDPHAPVLQPRDAPAARVDRGQRDLEATVTVEQSWIPPIADHALLA